MPRAPSFKVNRTAKNERAGPLYMLAPRDPLIIETGCFASQVYEVLGNGYGLPDAPRVWHKRVHQRATERNFRQHGFDKYMYYSYYATTLRTEAGCPPVFIVHVDDFLCAYHEQFDESLLEKMFVWGSVTHVNLDNHGVYRGKEIRLVKEDNRFSYKVTQSAFIESMTSGKIPRGRSRQSEKLTPEEWTAVWRDHFNGWARKPGPNCVRRSGCRTEVPTSDTTFHDLKRLYEAVEYLRLRPVLPRHSDRPGDHDPHLHGQLLGQRITQKPIRRAGDASAAADPREDLPRLCDRLAISQ